jgi:hypothetical protein
MAESNTSRRRFLIHAAVAVTALPLLARSIGSAHAETLPKLPLDNAQAKALSYVEDATKTTAPNYKPGSTCSGCQFFTAATGACALFKGFSVSPHGWCSAWAKKAA